MAEKTKTGCVKKFFAIPEPLNDRLTQVATTECRSQTQIFVRASILFRLLLKYENNRRRTPGHSIQPESKPDTTTTDSE